MFLPVVSCRFLSLGQFSRLGTPPGEVNRILFSRRLETVQTVEAFLKFSGWAFALVAILTFSDSAKLKIRQRRALARGLYIGGSQGSPRR
jgi:hypothetical protein